MPGECWLLTGSKVRFGTAPGLEGDSVLLLFALGPRDEMESGSLKRKRKFAAAPLTVSLVRGHVCLPQGCREPNLYSQLQEPGENTQPGEETWCQH